AGITRRVALQIILVLRLRLPEVTGRGDLGRDPAGPDAGRLDIGDGIARDALLLWRGVEDAGTIARAAVVALAVQRRRIMDLEEELQQPAIAELCRIEDDLDRLGMCPVIAIGGVGHVAAGIADPRRDDARIAPQ